MVTNDIVARPQELNQGTDGLLPAEASSAIARAAALAGPTYPRVLTGT
jgi:hypothetical protein